MMKSGRRVTLLIMFLLLPALFNYFSPYLVIDAAVHKMAAGSFFVWLFMFVLSLVFGRVFCSYICPYGGLQMVIDKIINKPLKQSNGFRVFKLVLGICWLGGFIYVLIRQGGLEKVEFFYLTEKFISVDDWMKLVMYYIIIVGIGLLPFLVGKRASCHYLCPMAILNIVGTKIKNMMPYPSLRLIADPQACTSCKQCNKSCPMSLDVSGMVKENKMNHIECILCGECSKTCKFGAVSRKIG